MAIYFREGSPTTDLSDDALRAALFGVFERLGPRSNVLALPPDFTRFNSRAGLLCCIAYQYYHEALRDDGASQEKAARIANAAAKTSRSKVGEKGGEAGSYEDWTVDELRKRAAELDIEGRSGMKKDELIEALRNH